MLLDKLLSNLSVHVEPFALCMVSAGWRLHLPGPPGLLLHFVLEGDGVLYGPRSDAHSLARMHLALVPAGTKHTLESRGEIHDELRIDALPAGKQVCRIVAGSAEQPDLVVGCGIVSVRYGPSLDLFDHLKERSLRRPVERSGGAHRVSRHSRRAVPTDSRHQCHDGRPYDAMSRSPF